MRTRFCMWAACLAALLGPTLAPLDAAAHGGEPTITGLRFPPHRPGEVWGITDNQGLYAALGPQTAWLCEDAVAPAAGIIDIVALDDGQRWLVLTEVGLYASDDGGCTYRVSPVDLAGQQVAALSAHPLRAREAVAVTATFGEENAAWLSEDAGGTWRRTGLALRGRFLELMRSAHDPERLFALHDRGAFTSGDGGRTWDAMAPGPAELEALPSALTLLAAPVGGRVFVGVELPVGLAIAASDDAGQTWREVLRIDDFEADLAFDGAGRQGLLISAFDGARRTMDGGETWQAEPLPVDRLQHIGRDPLTGRLWGSTGLFFGGPFALGVSDDFGRTWQPALARFEDVATRWQCPEASPAHRCCGTLCPGQPVDAMCAGQVPDEGGACAAEPGDPPDPIGGPDAGLVDAGPPDAQVAPDMAPVDGGVIDGGVDGAPDGGQDGGSDVSPPTDQGPDAQRDRGVDGGADSATDRGGPDQQPADADLAADVRIAPDITVVPAYPPDDGCAQRPASPATPWPVILVALLCLAPGLRRRDQS